MVKHYHPDYGIDRVNCLGKLISGNLLQTWEHCKPKVSRFHKHADLAYKTDIMVSGPHKTDIEAHRTDIRGWGATLAGQEARQVEPD